MTQKLLMGGLALAILAVIGFGLIDAANTPQDNDAAAASAAAVPVSPEATDSPEPEAAPSIEAPRATTVPDTSAADKDPTQAAPVVQAADSMGEAWQAVGTVSALEDFGFTLTTADGDYFVELGPPTYWQAQGIPLAVGDAVSVDGHYNGEQVHASVVTAGDAELVIRSEAGQPMWATGADHGGDQQGAGGAQFQVSPDDWLTLTGVIGRVSNGQVSLNVDDGRVLDLQMGQPQFWQSQGITLSVGDPVEVLGFWSGEQFMAGDIRKTATGETIMLRDPNGRQLWAGPGRSGGGASGEQGGGNQDQGNGNQGNGNQGSGYQGGRGG